MSTPQTRQLKVVEKYRLTPNMLRIVLGGDALNDFPEDQEGCYVKVQFPVEDDQTAAGEKKPKKRSYTVRAFDAERKHLVLDFVAHGDNGPASAWANHTQVGDEIMIAGPGPVKLPDPESDSFFLVGDMTALPAISVILERLPAGAKGTAVIEIIDDKDQQQIDAPAGMNIQWIKNPHPTQPNSILVNAVKSQLWLPGRVGAWVACEFSSMRALREYFQKERCVAKQEMYISSYWKIGDTDEGHKQAKRSDQQ